YIVAKDNLGTMAGLTAGSSLMVSYILTVSVSVAAGVLALSSAFPVLHEWRVGLGVGAVVAITLINLRGIRESATIFMVPTYAFLVCMAALLGYGFYQSFFGDLKVTHSDLHTPEIVTGVSLFLILRAFASGGAALTGTEAIADGVPAFQPPEWINAQKTLMTMVVILAVMFGGITYLAWHAGAIPLEEGGETVVSQVARATFGTGPLYYTVQGATMMVLFLAANTAYSDYPRLSYFLARDHFLPHQFTYRGDRLAYSWGIVALGVLSAFVLWVFRGEISLLIPLYAFGVFSAFTLSQSGMVMRWWRLREPGWQTSIVFNTIGAIACFTVLAIVAVTKFLDGAWLAVILVPALILMMKAIHHHYTVAEVELTPETPTEPDQIKHTIIVPVSKLNQVALQTLAYARSIARDGDDSVTAVHVSDDLEETAELQREWQEWHCDVPLVIIESPYRSLSGPLLAYIDAIHAKRADDTLTVVMPEFVPQRWWEHLLHNQTALRLKAALLFRPGVVVTSVPYHLRRSESAVPAGSRGTRTHGQPGAAVEAELEHVSSLDGERVGTSGRRRKVVRHR
ncbi:MAG: APC family permease, partial [Chloroflexi bacterium]|nr:APC family permease [Chloroflexota bacterium]